MRQKQKLLIYIKFIRKTDKFKYRINPANSIQTQSDDHVKIQAEFNTNGFLFDVILDECEQGQALIIEKISVGDLDLTTAIDRIGAYITINNKRKTTYGYMDEPGTYHFKIKNNAMFTHFMSYLIGEVAK